MNYTNKEPVYNNPQRKLSDDYYYTKPSENKSNNTRLNNYYSQKTSIPTKQPIHSDHSNVNNNNNNDNPIHHNKNRTIFRSSSSMTDNPSSTPPLLSYSEPLPPISHTHSSSSSTYYNDTPSYVNVLDQPPPSITLPPPNTLLLPEKNEYKNVFVKVKSKRINEPFNNYPLLEAETKRYSREEIDQLKKELKIEFNGVDTLEEFKRLNQNEQKKLIIQICRFLMRRAGIKSENSIPWKQLAMNNAAFTFVNWPLVLPSKPIEPGYPTRFESFYENVPYEDLSRLKTSHRKTLFMALRSGAIYAIKLQKKKKNDTMKNVRASTRPSNPSYTLTDRDRNRDREEYPSRNNLMSFEPPPPPLPPLNDLYYEGSRNPPSKTNRYDRHSNDDNANPNPNHRDHPSSYYYRSQRENSEDPTEDRAAAPSLK